ncbi:MAG: class I SAM-dependent DNA methyltransferase, partial [Candidatus Hodarchaeota archaeon]
VFWWILNLFDSDLESLLTQILHEIKDLDFGPKNQDELQSKDIFKPLYEDLFPRSLRHTLGEYFTPDWLVKYIISQIPINSSDIRFLDPACGSGTFLKHIVFSLRNFFTKEKNKVELFNIICNNVVGIDLNPLAVFMTRVNILLAIKDLLPFAKNNFVLPIYWADALRPGSSLRIGRFEYIVGNPPWINWESLPNNYRKESEPLWRKYNLFSLKGYAARMGGGKKDLAMLFLHRSMDLYLKDNGHLIFIIPQSVFQSAKTGEGFRKFQLSDKESFCVEKVDDLSKIKPFHAINKTAIIYCRKDKETSYPVPYNIWTVHKKIDPKRFSSERFLEGVQVQHLWATPAEGKAGAPWVFYLPSDSDIVSVLSLNRGASSYKARAGVCTWMNGVFYLRILQKFPDGTLLIENLPQSGRYKSLPCIQKRIEPDLVFPLVRGRNVRLWSAYPSEYILVPQDPKKKTGLSLDKMNKNYPLSYEYLFKFKEFLEQRSGYKKYFTKEKDPFYTIYNVAESLFVPNKVVWPEIGDFVCSPLFSVQDKWLGAKVPLINNKIMYIPVESEEEAYYLSGVLNLPAIRRWINNQTLTTSTSTKIIPRLGIPKYDRNLDLMTHIKDIAIEMSGKWANISRELHNRLNQTVIGLLKCSEAKNKSPSNSL